MIQNPLTKFIDFFKNKLKNSSNSSQIIGLSKLYGNALYVMKSDMESKNTVQKLLFDDIYNYLIKFQDNLDFNDVSCINFDDIPGINSVINIICDDYFPYTSISDDLHFHLLYYRYIVVNMYLPSFPLADFYNLIDFYRQQDMSQNKTYSSSPSRNYSDALISFEKIIDINDKYDLFYQLYLLI